jgi:cellulase
MYKSNDPGLVYNKWTNNPATYIMPGPSVWNGGSSGSPPPTNPGNGNGGGGGSGGSAPLYGQCGGNGWTGPTTCSSGRCVASNEWYSQCVP